MQRYIEKVNRWVKGQNIQTKHSMIAEINSFKAEKRLKDIERHADRLCGLACQLNNLKRKQMVSKTDGRRVSLLGSSLGLASVAAAPFTGGISLFVSGVSALYSVSGNYIASEAQEKLQKETDSIMKEVGDCCDTIKRAQRVLETCFQEFEEYMNYFKVSAGTDIIKYIQTVEKNFDEIIWKKECDNLKQSFNMCSSVAQFLCVVSSQGSKRIMHSVLTVRFLLVKSSVILKYIPDVVFSQAALANCHLSTTFAAATLVSKAGNQTVNISAKVTKNVVSQRIGQNVVQSKLTTAAGTVQKRTTKVVESASTVSKIGLGLAALSIAVDAYYLYEANQESKGHHPDYDKVQDSANKIKSYVEQTKSQIQELTKGYNDMRLLHNQLLFIVDEIKCTCTSDESEDNYKIDDSRGMVENILSFLERSSKLLRSAA